MSTIQEVGTQIRNDLNALTDRKSIALLFAFNATWKTRLSVDFDAINEDEESVTMKVLSYNAFLEDLFAWDNDKLILEFKSHWVIDFIKKQDLEKEIKDIYSSITNSKVDPKFNYDNKYVSFPIGSMWADWETTEKNIKVSKSEESILIWAIFYAILETAIEALNNEKLDERIANEFNDLEYIVIDDPVSSIDDARITEIAVRLFNTIISSKNKQLNFLITTHHALFYNILFNSLRRIGKLEAKKSFYILSRNKDSTVNLEGQDDDTPFAYHLLVKQKIREAIDCDSIEKYHFNLLRSLLEKTANFLGYDDFSDCVLWEKKEQFSRIINLYSHGKISDLDPSIISNEDKELFIETFREFIENFKFK